MNCAADPSVLVVGEQPIKVHVTFRKGYAVEGNPTLLNLSFVDFENVVDYARKFIDTWRGLERFQSFDSLNSLQELFPDRVVRESLEQDAGSGETEVAKVVLFTASYMKKSSGETGQGYPIVNIREFVLDKRTKSFNPTKRGIGIGLQALYFLAYPCPDAVRKYHDIFLGVRLAETHLMDRASAAYDELIPFQLNGWEKNVDGARDALRADEESVKLAENDGVFRDVVNGGDSDSGGDADMFDVVEEETAL